jgi:hypothetical protein
VKGAADGGLAWGPIRRAHGDRRRQAAGGIVRWRQHFCAGSGDLDAAQRARHELQGAAGGLTLS